MTAPGIRVALRRVGVGTLLGALPVALVVAFLLVATAGDPPPGYFKAPDFHTFWEGSGSYVARESPYPLPEQLTTWSETVQRSFVYPPTIAAALAPLAVLPYDVAVSIFVPLLVLAVAVALWLLGVRDWRCYGALFISPITLTSISIGTLSPLLLLGLAAAWRWRDRRLVAGLAIGGVIVAKLFVWPLLVWLWFSGRRAAAAVAAVVAVGTSVVAWSWIGFEGLTAYARMLETLSRTEAPYGYSLPWLVGGRTATAAAALVGCVAVAAAARRDDRRGFAFGVVAAVLLTPILWLHYLVLLAAPVALYRPRLAVAWLIPLVTWVLPQRADGEDWRVVFVFVVVVATLAALSGRRWPVRGRLLRSTAPVTRTAAAVAEP